MGLGDFFKGSNKDKDGDSTPNIAKIMMVVTPLLVPGGDKKKQIGDVVAEFATDKNIKKVSTAIIEGVAKLQVERNTRFVISMESVADGSDIAVSIYTRSEDLTQLEIYRHIYLSQITQADILFLINNIFNGTTGTGELKQLAAAE